MKIQFAIVRSENVNYLGTPEEQREVLELLWDFSIKQEEKAERLASECENE